MINTVEFEGYLTRACVQDEAVAGLGHAFLRSEFPGGQHHVTHQGSIRLLQFVQRVDVTIGHDENVRGGNRMGIAKGRHLLILVEKSGWGFAGEDLTKDTRHSE